VATTGIILAGGKGIRLGQGKSLIVIDSQMLLERVYSVIKPLCDEVIVVTGNDQFRELSKLNINARIETDIISDRAAMGGLYTGLVKAKNKYSLAVACDMPFLNGRLLKYMIDEANGFDAAVPQISSYIEPLHAVYSKDCIETLGKILKSGNLSIFQLVQSVKTKYIPEKELDEFDPEHLSIFNINTREDLIKAEKIIKGEFIKTYHD
jgi:molybdenum cofactor guanylyltransferase